MYQCHSNIAIYGLNGQWQAYEHPACIYTLQQYTAHLYFITQTKKTQDLPTSLTSINWDTEKIDGWKDATWYWLSSNGGKVVIRRVLIDRQSVNHLVKDAGILHINFITNHSKLSSNAFLHPAVFTKHHSHKLLSTEPGGLVFTVLHRLTVSR